MAIKAVIEEFTQAVQPKYPDTFQRMKEYVNRIKAISSPQDEIAAELSNFAEHPCSDFTITWMKSRNMSFWIIAAQLHPSSKYLDALCKILECEAKPIWYEGIVDILYDLKDERSIPYLEKALTYELPDDPARDLGIKILQTLWNIGTEKANQIVETFTHSPSPELREIAEALMNEKQ